MGRETYSQWSSRQQTKAAARELLDQPQQRREDQKSGKVVGLWNARLAREAEPLFVPTIAAALRAGRPWLEFQCRACGMIGDVDVRRFDRHPRATLNSLIPDLTCPRCPDAFVRLRGLYPARGGQE